MKFSPPDSDESENNTPRCHEEPIDFRTKKQQFKKHSNKESIHQNKKKETKSASQIKKKIPMAKRTSKSSKVTKRINKVKMSKQFPWQLTSKERYEMLVREDQPSSVPGMENYPSKLLYGVTWAGSLDEILVDSDEGI